MEEVVIESPLSGSFEVTLPKICPCCLTPVHNPSHTVTFTVQLEDYAPSGSHMAHQVTVPYCRPCQEHVRASQGGDTGKRVGLWLMGILLVWVPLMVVAGQTLGPVGIVVGLAIVAPLTFVASRKALPGAPKPGSLVGHACTSTWAVAIGRRSVGTRVRFRFDSPEYAAAFRKLNVSTLAG